MDAQTDCCAKCVRTNSPYAMASHTEVRRSATGMDSIMHIIAKRNTGAASLQCRSRTRKNSHRDTEAQRARQRNCGYRYRESVYVHVFPRPVTCVYSAYARKSLSEWASRRLSGRNRGVGQIPAVCPLLTPRMRPGRAPPDFARTLLRMLHTLWHTICLEGETCTQPITISSS